MIIKYIQIINSSVDSLESEKLFWNKFFKPLQSLVKNNYFSHLEILNVLVIVEYFLLMF